MPTNKKRIALAEQILEQEVYENSGASLFAGPFCLRSAYD
jgi:hypothetical protein